MAEPLTNALAQALARAQAQCPGAPHDARNEFHKYDYTSAEALIATAKVALAESGLALVPLSTTWTNADGGPLTLTRQWLLQHTSGEVQSLRLDWPIVPGGGRPLDKAVASAVTTALAYLLRDLLLIPRVPPGDDLAGREDRPLAGSLPRGGEPPVQARSESRLAAPADDAPLDPEERYTALKALLQRKGKPEASVWRFLRRQGENLHQLTAQEYTHLKKALLALPDKPSSPE